MASTSGLPPKGYCIQGHSSPRSRNGSHMSLGMQVTLIVELNEDLFLFDRDIERVKPGADLPGIE